MKPSLSRIVRCLGWWTPSIAWWLCFWCGPWWPKMIWRYSYFRIWYHWIVSYEWWVRRIYIQFQLICHLTKFPCVVRVRIIHHIWPGRQNSRGRRSKRMSQAQLSSLKLVRVLGLWIFTVSFPASQFIAKLSVTKTHLMCRRGRGIKNQVQWLFEQ